jgi:uncharacterized membrane protein YgdD (TMEM256/DUF423 family)
MKPNIIISIGSLNAALAIIFGAFAAHGLKGQLDAYSLDVFNTAVDFHFWQSIGIMLVGLLTKIYSDRNFNPAMWAMLLGIVFFCGSLYLLSITGLKWLGAITPLGGVLFIFAWSWLSWKLLKGN